MVIAVSDKFDNVAIGIARLDVIMIVWLWDLYNLYPPASRLCQILQQGVFRFNEYISYVRDHDTIVTMTLPFA